MNSGPEKGGRAVTAGTQGHRSPNSQPNSVGLQILFPEDASEVDFSQVPQGYS